MTLKTNSKIDMVCHIPDFNKEGYTRCGLRIVYFWDTDAIGRGIYRFVTFEQGSYVAVLAELENNATDCDACKCLSP